MKSLGLSCHFYKSSSVIEKKINALCIKVGNRERFADPWKYNTIVRTIVPWYNITQKHCL